jgi:hypothetical protein
MMEAAGDVGDVFMSFVLCYWPWSHRLEPLAHPSGDVAWRALSTIVEVPTKAKVMK